MKVSLKLCRIETPASCFWAVLYALQHRGGQKNIAIMTSQNYENEELVIKAIFLNLFIRTAVYGPASIYWEISWKYLML